MESLVFQNKTKHFADGLIIVHDEDGRHGVCLPFFHCYCCVTLYSPMFISVRVPHHAVSGESWQDAG